MNTHAPDQFLFIALPYVCLFTFLLMTIYRYRHQSFSYFSLSSQFLENKQHFWAVVPFHYGILAVTAGHLIAILIPRSILAWNSHPLQLYCGGDEDDVHVSHQPMMCQHCDNAPCETVCPVLATVHSSEGLIEQVHSRCGCCASERSMAGGKSALPRLIGLLPACCLTSGLSGMSSTASDLRRAASIDGSYRTTSQGNLFSET